MEPLEIPTDVTAHIKRIFSDCNNSVTKDLSTFPAIYEESLDSNLIAHFSRNQAPVKLPSDWLVRIDAHFIGGGRHFGTWEVADIAIMMVFRRKGKVFRSKLAFLQSKKLYANTLVYREDHPFVRRFGLGRMLVTDEEHQEIISDKLLAFKSNSRYKAFRKNSEQQETMGHFERRWDMGLHYLFYNPCEIPWAVKMPSESTPEIKSNNIGCRIVKKSDLDRALKQFDDNYCPSYSDLEKLVTSDNIVSTAGWRMEDFVADLMLQCKEGIIDDSPNFESLSILMDLKSRPISAAVSVTFDVDS